ncbi:helix-turn-helix transcriptional regulator [Streptobacillus felis]|uniref:helix-turn-helix domain-containing protein n=1 Tax=Streptobacillus felis TaxID=1384509 RepID=UPI000830E28C|nr:helix-turn-helix transcriptional regulator [Streptobacillus felis]
MSIDKKLKSERKRLKLTMERLAELSGINVSKIKAYENGYTKNIPLENLTILSKIFGKDINYFLLDDNNTEKDDTNPILDSILTINEALLSKITLMSEKDIKRYLKHVEKFLKDKI